MSKTKNFEKNIIDKWCKLYNSGVSSVEISKKYGVASNSVIYNLRKVGVRIRTSSEVKLGELNPKWVGEKVKYFPLHRWVERHLKKPEKCQICGLKPPYDLSNKGIYNRDLCNWEWICRSCHMKQDGRISNLKQYAKNR